MGNGNGNERHLEGCAWCPGALCRDCPPTLGQLDRALLLLSQVLLEQAGITLRGVR